MFFFFDESPEHNIEKNCEKFLPKWGSFRIDRIDTMQGQKYQTVQCWYDHCTTMRCMQQILKWLWKQSWEYDLRFKVGARANFFDQGQMVLPWYWPHKFRHKLIVKIFNAMELETPPALHGQIHLKFSLWLLKPFPQTSPHRHDILNT